MSATDSSTGADGSCSLSREDVNIQDVIRDRATYRKMKAEQKRQVDLQRVRDMKSTTGIDPLQRFPKEIWMMIIDELSPEDRWNIWQIHPLFHDLMESTRVVDILLPQIMKFDKFRDYVSEVDNGDWNGSYDYTQQLRCISKSMRKWFDLWTVEDLVRRIREVEEDQGGEAHTSSYVAEAVNLRLHAEKDRLRLKRLLTSFLDGENPGKCFFPRDVSVAFPDFTIENGDERDEQEIVMEFKRDITTLFEKIGDQILYLRFNFDNIRVRQFSSMEVYALFLQLISLAPNIRWLEVDIPASLQRIEIGEHILRPFPRLMFLERMSIHCHFPFPSEFKVYEYMLAANQHVTMLDIGRGNDAAIQQLPARLIKSLHLTSLAVYDDFLKESACLSSIQEHVNFNWPLETIIIAMDETETEPFTSINSVFQFLERFPTLRNVKLKELKGLRIGVAEGLDYLTLPNLTSLELTLREPDIDYEADIHFFFSLQFLVNCDKLQKLFWSLCEFDNNKLRRHLKVKEKESRVKILDFRAGLKFLYDSDIWKVFPFLDSIETFFLKNRKKEYCSQKYLRRDTGRIPTVSEFLEMHGCSFSNSLSSCVVLAA